MRDTSIGYVLHALKPGMCPYGELNQWPFGSQASTQSTEPHWAWAGWASWSVRLFPSNVENFEPLFLYLFFLFSFFPLSSDSNFMCIRLLHVGSQPADSLCIFLFFVFPSMIHFGYFFCCYVFKFPCLLQFLVSC